MNGNDLTQRFHENLTEVQVNIDALLHSVVLACCIRFQFSTHGEAFMPKDIII